MSARYQPLGGVNFLKVIMNKRKSFLMYLDWHKNIKKMSQEEKGLLVDLMYAAYNREELPTIPEKFLVLDIFWDTIDSIIRRNLRDYDSKLDKQSDSPTDSLKTVRRQTTDNKPTTDTDTATGKETAKVTVKEKEKAIATLKRLDRMEEFNRVFE